MPTVHRIRNIALVIFTHDHEPPHLHAVCPDFEVKVTLATRAVQIVRGKPGRLNDVLAWIQANEASLMAAWERTRSGP